MIDRLRSAIAASGLSPYELSRKSGVSPQIIYRFMNTERGIRLITAGKLAEALGLELVKK